MHFMDRWREQLRRDPEQGASLVEYALLVMLIAVVAIVAVTALGESANDNLSRSASRVVGAGS